MSSIRDRLTAPGPVAKTIAAPARARAEIIVVTHDPELERALREASPTAPVMLATTPAALADLLMTGRAGTLVLDVAALDAAALTVARHLAEQFPDVPLVAVGSREDEARLAGLISSGLVYRFLHRPVSVARARTFVEAALRRHGGSRAAAAARATPAAPPRRAARSTALAVAAACATLGVGFVLALRTPSSTEQSAAPRAVVTGVVAGEQASRGAAINEAPPPAAPPPVPAAARARAVGADAAPERPAAPVVATAGGQQPATAPAPPLTADAPAAIDRAGEAVTEPPPAATPADTPADKPAAMAGAAAAEAPAAPVATAVEAAGAAEAAATAGSDAPADDRAAPKPPDAV